LPRLSTCDKRNTTPRGRLPSGRQAQGLLFMWTHFFFIVFVALAVYTQNLTGFALALVLLGLVGVVNLLPLPDVANALTVIVVVNAFTLFRRRRVRFAHIERAIFPAVVASLAGSLVGMAILTHLANNAYQVLRTVLGVIIIGCALLLWRTARPQQQSSGTALFWPAGWLVRRAWPTAGVRGLPPTLAARAHAGSAGV